jgi:LPXTG-site transpeptidase (sortase) family protein
VVAFLVTIGLTLARNDGGSSTPDVPTTIDVQVQRQPTAVATVVPTPAHRTDCTAIRGTDYRSDAERTWFQQNCGAGTTAAAATSGGGGGAATGTISGPAAAPARGQAPIGDRLIIPSIGVDADVWSAYVDGSGSMPDPVGYFNVVWYDFSGHGGLGGYGRDGNMVLAGHIDSARYGAAVFYYIRNIQINDQIQYRMSNGTVLTYRVTAVADYLPTDNWAQLVSTNNADMTLITCIGTFNTAIREYSHRRVVMATLV